MASLAGQVCPQCRSKNLVKGHLNVDYEKDEIWRNVKCESCGLDADEVYGFSHYADAQTTQPISFHFGLPYNYWVEKKE